jgi:hypothetical protein
MNQPTQQLQLGRGVRISSICDIVGLLKGYPASCSVEPHPSPYTFIDPVPACQIPKRPSPKHGRRFRDQSRPRYYVKKPSNGGLLRWRGGPGRPGWGQLGPNLEESVGETGWADARFARRFFCKPPDLDVAAAPRDSADPFMQWAVAQMPRGLLCRGWPRIVVDGVGSLDDV